MNLSYILNHLGEERDRWFGAVTPPLVQTSNYAFRTVKEYRRAARSEKDIPLYTRGNNPTTVILCRKLAALEGAEDALVFGSGMAAISAAVLSCLNAGDHVICVKNVYGWTRRLFTGYLPRFGVETTFVDGTRTANFKEALRPNTRLIYLESPTSFLFELQDIKAVTFLARRRSITTIADNSYAGPLSQQPLSMGVDIVVHTATKYLGGHSDVVAGVLCASKKMTEKIFRNEFMTLGGILSPHDAWLMLRSLRTLQIRMQRSGESTRKVVAFLEKHPSVEMVLWPFSRTYTQRSLTRKQMSMPSGMFSVLLKTRNEKKIETFCDNLEFFLIAVSWGGHESLILPACAISDYDKRYELPKNLIRFYIGMEEPEVLIGDLESALTNFI